MGKSLIPVPPKSPLGQQANLKYKPTFKARKSVTTVPAGDSEANTAQSKSDTITGHKATPTVNSPVVPISGRKQPLVTQKATTIPGPSKIIHGSGAEDTCSLIYTKPRREQLISVPSLKITGAPQLRVEMSLPATSKADVCSDTYTGYIMPSTRVQKAASVPSYSSYSKKIIGGNTYSSYATPKNEQLARLPQLAAPKNPILANISSGSDITIKQPRYTPLAPLKKTSELNHTVQEAASIYQLVASEKIEPDNGLNNGQTGLEHAQLLYGPYIPIDAGSQSVVSNTLSPYRPDQNIPSTGSGDTVKCTLSEAVLPAEEASKGMATAIGQTGKTEKKSAVVIGQAKDTPRLDSESDKEKPEGGNTISDPEAPGGKGVDDVEMYEQMDSSEGLKSHPVGNIPVANAHNAAAKFHPKAPAAYNTLGQAIDQAIQSLHSNPAAGPATPKMVLDHLGFAIIGHATIHGGHRPEAIKSLIENSLLKYRQDQERKERNCASYMQQLGIGPRIQDHDMLDYRTDNAAEGTENYMMEDIEETGIQRGFSQSYSQPFLTTGTATPTSAATPTDRTNLRFVDGCFEIEDEVMEDLRDEAAQVLGMSEYLDSDDSDTPRSTRSNSPELVTDSEIFTNGMDLDDMEDLLLRICKLSLSTEPCTSKESNNMGNSLGTGLENTQYMHTIEAGDCIMAGSTEDMDSVGAGDIIMKTDCTQGADGTGKSEHPNDSCSTKKPSDTKNVDKTGDNNTNNKADSTMKAGHSDGSYSTKKPSDTKNVDNIEESNSNNKTDSTGKAGDSDGNCSIKKPSDTKNVDKIGGSNTNSKMDSTGRAGDSDSSCSIKKLNDTKNTDKTGENNTNSKMDNTGGPKKTNELLMAEKGESSKDMGAIEMSNHPTKEAVSLESSNGVGAVDSQELDRTEKMSVTKGIDTNGSGHIKKTHRGELPLGIGGFEDGGNMSSPEVFDNPVSLYETVDNGENICSPEGVDGLVSFGGSGKGVRSSEGFDNPACAQIAETVHDEDIGGFDSSVEICDGVRDADNVEFLRVLENIVPLTVVQTTDTFHGTDIGDIVDSSAENLDGVEAADQAGFLGVPEIVVPGRVADRVAELSDEAGDLGGRKEETEKERVMANIKSLEPVYTSCQKKLESWEGFVHSGKGWAPAPAPVAVKVSVPVVVVTVIPKGIAAPTGTYIWGCIFPFICISVLLSASGPSAILGRLQASISALDPGIYPMEISLLFLLLVRISLCWRSKETIKTNVSRMVRETIGLF